MASYEAGLMGSFASDKNLVSENLDTTPISFTQVIRETAGAISRRVMWVIELLATACLVFCLSLLLFVHQGPEGLALGIAAIYFSFSAGLGAYLLRLDLTDNRGRR